MERAALSSERPGCCRLRSSYTAEGDQAGEGETDWRGIVQLRHLDRRDAWLAALVLVLSLALRLAYLESIPTDFSSDEGLNAQVVESILDGKMSGAVVTRIVAGEEAGAFYLKALSAKLFGLSIWSLRVPAALFCGLLPPLFYVLARSFTGPLAAFIAAVLLAMNGPHLVWSRQASCIGYGATAFCLTTIFLQRSLVRSSIASFIGLGLALGVGIHTYPSFRLVPFLVLATLVGHALSVPSRDRRAVFFGTFIVLDILVLSATPLLWDAEGFRCYLDRLQTVSIAGGDVGAWEPLVQDTLPKLPQILLGVARTFPTQQLYPPLVGCLMLVGLLVVLLRHAGLSSCESQQSGPSAGTGAQPARPTFPGLLLLFLLAAAVLPALLVTYQADHARRFLFGLVTFHLLAAIGLDALLSARDVDGRPGRVLRLSVVASIVVALAFLPLRNPFKALWSIQSPGALKVLLGSLRFARENAVLIPAGPMLYSWNDWDISPELDFVLDSHEPDAVQGLNHYPLIPPEGDLFYLVSRTPWLTRLQAIYPEGKVIQWSDPYRDQTLQFYHVSGQSAWRHQGLSLSASGPDGVAVSRRSHGVAIPARLSPSLKRFSWTGSLYLDRPGLWKLAVSAKGSLALSVGNRSGREQPGDVSVEGYFAEGWHRFSLEWSRESRRDSRPRVHWTHAESGRDGEIPPEYFLSIVPPETYLLARPTSSRLSHLEPIRVEDWWADWERNGERNLYTDVAFVGEHLVALASGSNSLGVLAGRRTRSEEVLPSIDRLDDLLAFDALWSTDMVSTDLSVGPGGDVALIHDDPNGLYLYSSTEDRMLFFPLDVEDGYPVRISHDPGGNQFILTNGERDEIRRFRATGEELSPWPIIGAVSICFVPGGGYAVVVPRRGGILRLDQEGNEVAFWRETGVSPLSRITADEQGRVYVTLASRRILVYDSSGNVIVPWQQLPSSQDGKHRLLPQTLSILPSGQLAMAVGRSIREVVVARLQPGPVVRTKMESVPTVPVEEPIGPSDP